MVHLRESRGSSTTTNPAPSAQHRRPRQPTGGSRLRGRAGRWPSTGRRVVPAGMSGAPTTTTRWRFLSLCARWIRR